MTQRTAEIGDARAWLGLALVPQLLPRRAFTLVERFGSPRAVIEAPAAALTECDLAADVIDALRRSLGRADEEAAAIERAGAQLVAWSDPDYPTRLRQIADPPLVLARRGELAPDAPAVAVVGARRASDYGRRMAEELGRGLAQAGLVVVSGLAAGIDAAAHRAALAAGGRTVAVLGTGIDRVYPPWHGALARDVAGQGALLSEFPCGAPPLQYHFPQRNRIISGIALGTVVVEAAEQSGSLITARYAMEQGRDVFAVPGPAGVALHRGPHRLIQQGAKLVTAVEDVLDEIAPALVARVAAARAAAEAVQLTPLERVILGAVGDGQQVDAIIHRAAVAPGPALETLLALELRGLVEQVPGKRFRRRAA